jgi:zinc transport system permease protein
MFLDLLQYGFVQRAIFGGIIIALSCALIGTFLVLRRLSLIGDGIAHLAFGGIAAGMLLGIQPLLVALVVAVLGSVWVQRVVTRLHVYGEAAIAVIIALGMSVGIVIIGAVKGFTVDLFSFLFGSILTLNVTDLALSAGVLAAALLFIGTQYQNLVLLSFNEDLARTHGVRAGRINLWLGALTAATVVIAIRAVGILLVSALLVIPTITALQLARSFRQTMLLAIFSSLIAVFVGITLALWLDLPVGGLIVLMLIAEFAGAISYKHLSVRTMGST